jgi:hypothetical protein
MSFPISSRRLEDDHRALRGSFPLYVHARALKKEEPKSRVAPLLANAVLGPMGLRVFADAVCGDSQMRAGWRGRRLAATQTEVGDGRAHQRDRVHDPRGRLVCVRRRARLLAFVA